MIFIEWINSLAIGTVFENKYLLSLLIVIVFAMMGGFVLFIFTKYLQRFASKTKNKIDDLVFHNVKGPLFLVIVGYGIKLGLLNLQVNGTITKVVNSVMAIVFLYAIMKGIDIIIETWAITFSKRTKSNLDDVLLPMLQKVTKVLFALIGLMWVLRIWNIDITPYLAGVGIGGIVLGLALQDSLKNVLGGISLLLDKTYQVGDKIQLESGEVGTIYDIGLRSTKLVNFDNEVVYIPNGYLANSRVLNYARPDPKVRTRVFFGVEYGTDVDKVRKLVLDILTNMDGVLADPAPTVQFIEMGDFALKFRANFWVEKWNMAYDKKLEATEKIYNALRKAKIGIPFPTQTIHLKK
ncbi:mechanosensitive ion channel family protein [Candidatus Woesearchaeota archaeon]|nr:mechanosensitive ion channel family protein [Candidatus Woesearchaeota archaeon]